jgi:hypothetical protein
MRISLTALHASNALELMWSKTRVGSLRNGYITTMTFQMKRVMMTIRISISIANLN